jgi:hypothetical protein
MDGRDERRLTRRRSLRPRRAGLSATRPLGASERSAAARLRLMPPAGRGRRLLEIGQTDARQQQLRDHRCPSGHVKLKKDALHVRLHRMFADSQMASYLLSSLPESDQHGDLHLSFR